MLRPPYECTYCGLEDGRGLYSPINANTGPLCRECYDQLPKYIDFSQWHMWLKSKIKRKWDSRHEHNQNSQVQDMF
jgi:hypothetical protein